MKRVHDVHETLVLPGNLTVPRFGPSLQVSKQVYRSFGMWCRVTESSRDELLSLPTVEGATGSVPLTEPRSTGSERKFRTGSRGWKEPEGVPSDVKVYASKSSKERRDGREKRR